MRVNFRFFFIILTLSLIGALYATIYVSMHRRQMKILPQKVVYFPNRMDTLPLFFIKNLKYKNDYVDYVNNQLTNRIHQVIRFPYQHGLGIGDTIYIRKYLKDSVLVEFYCQKYHDQLWGLATGYIHRSLVHDKKD